MAKPPTKNDVIKKYLFNDLDRFFKRLYRYNVYPYIFSDLIPQYENLCPGITKQLREEFKGYYPGDVCLIMNVHRVMVQFYNFEIDLEDIKLSHRISQVLESSFDEYSHKRGAIRYRQLYLLPKVHKVKKVVKELIARGFIHINDFEDYDKRMAHITTNVNIKLTHGKLYYPENFSWDAWSKDFKINRDKGWWHFNDIYKVHGKLGISGFTRILTPLDR